MKKILLILVTLFISGCFDGDDAQAESKDSIQLGKLTFNTNCVACHGKGAQGLTRDWKQKLANGNFPAPPLNGTAHAWHHSPQVLLSTINNGGAKLGGWMPGFKDKLNDEEKQGLLDYIHSLWPAELQQKYDKRYK